MPPDPPSAIETPTHRPDTVSRRRYERERRAREEAEALLEAKSRELYEANCRLQRQADTLEEAVKERTAELEAAMARADAASAAKSDFLAVMSHEIRTPLNGVIGMAGALGETALSADQRSMLTVIRDSGALLLEIMNDILDFSKIEAGKLELESAPFDPLAAAHSAARLFETSAREKGLFLKVAAPDGPPGPVRGDAVRFRQMLHNLVSNAIKFTAEGGVTVILRWADSGGQRVGLKVLVHDTGVGIAAEKQALLFQPFQQVDASAARRASGTGLGLAITRRLATLMGGEVGVESEPGIGSSFWFQLPLQRAAVAATAEGPGDEGRLIERLAERRPHVIAADDNATNRMVLDRIFRNLPASLTLVASGQAVLEAAQVQAYDLALLDIQMPGLDGVETATRLQALDLAANRPPRPILALTANTGDEQVARYIDVGMAGCVSKPIRRHDLLQAIVDALG